MLAKKEQLQSQISLTKNKIIPPLKTQTPKIKASSLRKPSPTPLNVRKK